MKFVFLLLLFTSLIITVSASDDADISLTVDETQFPSYTQVINTDLPPLDRIDIAARLQGIQYTPRAIPQEITRQIGDLEFFRVNSVDGGGTADIPARLSAIGTHVYLWIEDGIVVDEAILLDVTHRFDIQVYEYVRSLWGSEDSPGIDGETRLHIVFTQRLRAGLGGYFSSANTYPEVIAPGSNEYDMMILDSDMLEPQNINRGISTLAHEFQHMIHHSQDLNEINWLNEGLATLTEYLTGLDYREFLLNSFLDAPETSLTQWGLGRNRSAEYGAPALFMIYLYDRFGLSAIQQIASDPDNGLQSIDNLLRDRGESGVDIIFADWVLANLLRENEGNYSYQTLVGVNPVDFQAEIRNYPSVFTFELSQYASHYYHYLTVPDSLSISLQMPDSVPIIPVNASSGQMMWYSQRGDRSNPRLTRTFDLTQTNSAQLTFNLWYDLENEWDYAYISVSSDGGQIWELQSTPLMTAGNTNERALGQGYTGLSDGWQSDTLSLDAYTGQEILVRFEMATDDAINHSGIAIDDMRLDATGYQSNFENDDGGWVPEGWVRIDNRLPQRAWVQVIEHSSTDSIVHRFLADGTEQWQISPVDSTESVYIVLSPFAPMTSEIMSYTLQVE